MPQAPTVELPKELPLVSILSNRDETLNKDARMVNCYVEKDLNDGKFWLQKRVGLKDSVLFSEAAAIARGIYNSTGVNYQTFFLLGTLVYYIDITGASAATLTPDASVTGGALNTTGSADIYSFVTVNNATAATRYTVFGNGSKAYYVKDPGSSTTYYQITDANFPTVFTPFWAYLDGTLYVASGPQIFGSKNIEDPTVWDALNVILVGQQTDNVVYLGIQLVYVIALTGTAMQAFYDAANPTGSPLSPVPGALLSYGCIDGNTAQIIDDIMLWCTSNNTVSPQVVRMDNLAISVVSTPGVERLLDAAISTPFNGTHFGSFVFKHGGHRFYILHMYAINISLAYDIDMNLWFPWLDSGGNFWPIVGQAFALIPTAGQRYYQHLFQHKTNGKIYYMDGAWVYPNDDGVVASVDIYTTNFTAGVRARKKFLKVMGFDADQVVGCLLQVRSSDDDYQTWSNFRTVDLGVLQPELTDEGSFYRRAYHFRMAANTNFRIKSATLQLDIGTL